MEDFFDKDDAIAFVYLLADGDRDNMVYVSHQHLLVIRKGKRHTFRLDHLRSISTATKKLLLPLLLGGIITPFAFVSFFVNLFLPWVHLIMILGGMALFYVGMMGMQELTITSRSGEEHNFSLSRVSKNLVAFNDFVNHSFLNPTNSPFVKLIFFDLMKEEQDQLLGRTIAKNKASWPLFGYTYNQALQVKKNLSEFIIIDPSRAGAEVKFEFDLQTDQLRPCVREAVAPDSVVQFDDIT